MKGLKYMFRSAALLAAVALTAACTGVTESETGIKADKSKIYADGVDAVTFTVDFEGVDITSEATIKNRDTGEVLEGNVFTTETAGTYNFTAIHEGVETYFPISITAEEATLELSIGSYREEGEGDGLTRYFTFAARYGTRDVTLDEGLAVFEVTDANDVALVKESDGYFRTTTVGETTTKRFYATWNGHRSPDMTAGAVRFYKRAGTLYFTGTWCQYCSVMAGHIKGAAANYPDRNVWIAVHAKQDALAIPYAADLILRLRIGVSLPAASINFGVAPNPVLVGQNSTSPQDFESRIKRFIESGPANCGLKIATSVNGNTATATVNLRTAGAMNYGIMAALVEDGISGDAYKQYMPDGGHSGSYVHDHTLRKVFGDNIEGVQVGDVAAGAEVSREFTFDLTGCNPANSRIVVFATSGTGDALTLVNAAECPVGQTVDYKYESAE